MSYLSRINLSFFLLLLISGSTFAQVDSVIVTISETAGDSLGPWTYNIQNIDSLNSSGRVESKTRRLWNGTAWENNKAETFLYNSAGSITEQVKLDWNGTTFIPKNKTENIYNTSGKLSSEINYQFSSNSWNATTKHEYSYSQQLMDSSILSYTRISGNWNLTDQHLLSYNSNGLLISDLWKSRNGSSWDTVSIKKYSYSQATSELTNDSVFFYSSPDFLLQQTSAYVYFSGNNTQKISRDFYSYVYSDPDTNYVESELDFEYTLTVNYNGFGQKTEQHGAQTKGSSQAWVYEHNYFEYDASGNSSLNFSHAGTNLSETYQRHSKYYYRKFNADFRSEGTSCIGCLNGSVDVSVWGGVPNYQVHVPSGIGTVNGMTVENLPVGIHHICVLDAIGNEICRDIQIQEYSSGITVSDESASEFLVTNEVGNSVISIAAKSSHLFSFLIFDIMGRVIVEQTNQSNKTQINTSSLPAGTFYYHVYNESKNKTGSVVIINH